jgi:hypothetical protein
MAGMRRDRQARASVQSHILQAFSQKNGDTGPDFERWLPACFAFFTQLSKGAMNSIWQKS